MLDVRTPVGPVITTEPIVAWRAWTLGRSRRTGRVDLRPIAGATRPWPVLQPAQATCARARLHRPPRSGCTCGLHATHSVDALRRTRNPTIVGTVAMWGRVIEHEFGYRAQFAYPQRLRLVCYLCFFHSGLSGALPDVVVGPTAGRLSPLCPEHLALSERYGFPTRRRRPAEEAEGELLSAYAVDLLRG